MTRTAQSRRPIKGPTLTRSSQSKPPARAYVGPTATRNGGRHRLGAVERRPGPRSTATDDSDDSPQPLSVESLAGRALIRVSFQGRDPGPRTARRPTPQAPLSAAGGPGVRCDPPGRRRRRRAALRLRRTAGPPYRYSRSYPGRLGAGPPSPGPVSRWQLPRASGASGWDRSLGPRAQLARRDGV